MGARGASEWGLCARCAIMLTAAGRHAARSERRSLPGRITTRRGQRARGERGFQENLGSDFAPARLTGLTESQATLYYTSDMKLSVGDKLRAP
eukprot:751502-Hanusia_phi.AAC.1